MMYDSDVIARANMHNLFGFGTQFVSVQSGSNDCVKAPRHTTETPKLLRNRIE